MGLVFPRFFTPILFFFIPSVGVSFFFFGALIIFSATSHMGNEASVASDPGLVEKIRNCESQLLGENHGYVEKVSIQLKNAMRKKHSTSPMEKMRKELATLLSVNLDAYDRWIQFAAFLLALQQICPDSSPKIQEAAPGFPYLQEKEVDDSDDDLEPDAPLSKGELERTLGDFRASILAEMKTIWQTAPLGPASTVETTPSLQISSSSSTSSTPKAAEPIALVPPAIPSKTRVPPPVKTSSQAPAFPFPPPPASGLYGTSVPHLALGVPTYLGLAPFSIRHDSWRRRGILGASLNVPNGPNTVLDYLLAEINKELSSEVVKIGLIAQIDGIYNLIAQLQPFIATNPMAAAHILDSVFNPLQRSAEAVLFYLSRGNKFSPSFVTDYYKSLEGHSGDFVPSEVKSHRKAVKSWCPLKTPSASSFFRPGPFSRASSKGDWGRGRSPRKSHSNSRSRSSSAQSSVSPQKPRP